MTGTGVEIGVTDSSLMRLKGARGQFIKFDMEAELALRESMVGFAFALREALIRTWKEGGHDKTGASLETLTVTSGPMWVRAHMEGGSAYVETGTPPHIISVRSSRPGFAMGGPKALHWTGGGFGEGDHFAQSVHHPGYKGDPFVERAYDSAEIEGQLSKVATEVFAKFDENTMRGTFTGALAEPFSGRRVL